MDEEALRDAARSLRRTAIHTRHSRQAGWLSAAIELETAAAQREAEADALASV